ncbi:hypothetical protein FNF28_04612 [Cafeteria roenbergensis]|nr:hypothetical protein FNF28_04612 [Cafeteria roenbergensis]
MADAAAATAATAPLERTLALIKPDACGRPWMEKVMKKVEEETEDGTVERWVETSVERAPDKAAEILKRIEGAGFRIAKQVTRRLTKAQAEGFYAEHRGKPFFEKLTDFMTSGPIVSLVLEREMAIKGWRALMGPTNSIKAREEAAAAHPLDESQWGLRALFGTDGSFNATHGSDSPFSALREEEFFFPQKPRWERTMLVLLPGAAEHEAEVTAQLEQREFVCIARKQRALTADQAAMLCDGAAEGAAAAAQGGECVCLVLERSCAALQLYLMVGPREGKATAKDKAPASINAVFSPGADDGDGLAALAPRSAVDAARAIDAVFEGPLPVEHTLAVIKPGTADEHRADIMREIRAHGFTIAAQRRARLSKEQVESFYEEHRGKFFFERLTSYIASGPVIAMVLAKPGAIKAWRALMGPTNTFKARTDAPSSLRARFGIDGTRNATHGSDAPGSAAREIRFYFPDFAPHTLPSDDEAKAFVERRQVAMVYNPVENNSVPATLRSVLVQGMTALAKARPSEDKLEALRWLGQWLVDHNPRRGTSAEKASPRPAHDRAGRRGVVVEEQDDEETKNAEDRGGGRGSARSAASGAGAAAALSPQPSVVEVSSELHVGRAGYAEPTAASDSKRRIVFVLGAPGSGKGTQCARLSEAFGYTHLSTGDLLRAEVASESELGKELQATMSTGGLVSTATVLQLLRKAMDDSGSSRFLVDGYPRALDQAFAFEKAVGKPAMVLDFAALEATLEARLVKRGETSGRADDKVEAIRHRFAVFKEQSSPVIDFYRRLGVVRSVDTEGKTPDEVFEATKEHFKPQVIFVLGGPASGRSSLCAQAAADLGWTHVSTGELLRAEAALGTELGAQVGKLLARGDLVPAELTLRVLQAGLARDKAGMGRFLLDGYPRTLEQATLFEKAVGRPMAVVHCDAPDDVLRSRARARRHTAGRNDHSQASVDRQLASFNDKTRRVLDMYDKQALVTRVDTNQPRERTYADFRKVLLPQIYFVLGGPGSGKGTQCARLVEEFGFVHLSAGDLLRAERSRGSEDGAMIEAHIVAGSIVPVSTTLALLKEAMRAAGAPRFLIDGFPRAMDQAEGFEEAFGLPSGVLFFDCPEAAMRERLLERGKTSGRADDNEATIVKRFHTFQEQSMPVVHRYARSGLVMAVDATATPDEVYAETRTHFLPNVVFVLGGPGSGKGTQCAQLKEEFGFTHLSMGDLFRAEVASGSAVGREMQELMKDGLLVPPDTTVAMLRGAIRRSPGRKFLIDGFPRSRDQAEAFERLVCQPQTVLFFDCPEAEMRKRLLARGKTSGRADDNEATIVKRFHTFLEQSMPVVADYKARGLLRSVSAVPPSSEVYAATRVFFQPELVVLCGAAGSGRGEFSARAGLELGYHTLRVRELLEAEAAHETPRGRAVRRALSMKRTSPLDATVAIVKEAISRSKAGRFILDGFPRLTSEGFPAVHDQVFALDQAVGPVRGCVCLDAHLAQRKARIAGTPTVGEEAALMRSVSAFQREKLPVVSYFEAMGKSRVVDTTPKPDEVFQAAAPFLE